jgi:hypothetical protein
MVLHKDIEYLFNIRYDFLLCFISQISHQSSVSTLPTMNYDVL